MDIIAGIHTSPDGSIHLNERGLPGGRQKGSPKKRQHALEKREQIEIGSLILYLTRYHYYFTKRIAVERTLYENKDSTL
jgi:hypothetical protein